MRQRSKDYALCLRRFQFTHPGRGATAKKAGGYTGIAGFNSRTPGGVRHATTSVAPASTIGFNSRTPGGVRPVSSLGAGDDFGVSIHAPREGCDSSLTGAHTPHAASFNSRTPGGVRLVLIITPMGDRHVSIHAPREGCDHDELCSVIGRSVFQFTHPGRGATINSMAQKLFGVFQFTHPGRGATGSPTTMEIPPSGFNSRTPGGVRHPVGWVNCFAEWFQFTHPGRGATRSLRMPDIL